MSATIILYSDLPPSGRCLLLAKAISDISSLPSRDCLQLAEDIFNSKYKAGAPAHVPIKAGANTSGLKKLCAEYRVFALDQD
jgi:hypothetical protein